MEDSSQGPMCAKGKGVIERTWITTTRAQRHDISCLRHRDSHYLRYSARLADHGGRYTAEAGNEPARPRIHDHESNRRDSAAGELGRAPARGFAVKQFRRSLGF